jgi:hypothetical protein
MHDYNFKRGNLVLLCNTQIKKALNRKMHPRYLSPLIIIACNYGGAYILCELDGTVFHHPVATFHLLPYLACKSIPLPPNFINIDPLECTTKIDDDILKGPHDFQDN